MLGRRWRKWSPRPTTRRRPRLRPQTHHRTDAHRQDRRPQTEAPHPTATGSPAAGNSHPTTTKPRSSDGSSSSPKTANRPARIARILNQERIPAARGKTWHRQGVENILDNPVYAGELHGVKRAQPAIVSRQTVERRQTRPGRSRPRRLSSSAERGSQNAPSVAAPQRQGENLIWGTRCAWLPLPLKVARPHRLTPLRAAPGAARCDRLPTYESVSERSARSASFCVAPSQARGQPGQQEKAANHPRCRRPSLLLVCSCVSYTRCARKKLHATWSRYEEFGPCARDVRTRACAWRQASMMRFGPIRERRTSPVAALPVVGALTRFLPCLSTSNRSLSSRGFDLRCRRIAGALCGRIARVGVVHRAFRATAGALRAEQAPGAARGRCR